MSQCKRKIVSVHGVGMMYGGKAKAKGKLIRIKRNNKKKIVIGYTM